LLSPSLNKYYREIRGIVRIALSFWATNFSPGG
jgi:hypothetical protein